MSDNKSPGAVEPIFAQRMLVPTYHRIGERELEVTFLGKNAYGEDTWLLWNHSEPRLMGMLRQGEDSFTFEQRTSEGPLIHSDLSRQRVQKMLES